MKFSWKALVGALPLIAACTSQQVRNVDASDGRPAVVMNTHVDGSIVIGATPAALYMDGDLIAIIPRGGNAAIKLPCGMHEMGVKGPGSSKYTFRMHSLKLDPCDRGLPYLHITFEPFYGFFITRGT